MNNQESKYTVLIFEDDIELALDWKSEFSANGIAVEHAWDLDNAMSLCCKKKFDAIICDVFIRDGSGKYQDKAGFSLISHLRYTINGAPTWGVDVPIIVVTGAPVLVGFDVLTFTESMNTVGMRKPFSPSDLVEKVKKALEESGS